jgi:hypothetical protein
MLASCAGREDPPVAALEHRQASVAAETLLEAPFYIEVTGTIAYRGERVILAPNFICLVRLLDTTDPNAPTELDRAIIPGPLSIPLRYSVFMEGYQVDPTRIYVVDAHVFVPEDTDFPDPAAGVLLFRSFEPVPVLSRGNPARADIQLTMQPVRQ